jgi:HAE1 family hydrophobic/amphiphilic exporter-1
LVQAGSGQSNLTALNSTFRANVPQLFADVDRVKAKTKKVPLESVFGTLQAYLGSAYVNDFTYNNRSYQVRVQAESEFRGSSDDIADLDVRDVTGQMIPLGSIVDVQDSLGPSVVRRYNLYPSASINGSAAAGTSSGEALALMEQMAESRTPPGFGYAWTGMSYQEKLAAGGQATVFLLAVVAVFLVLAAQYESWTSPAAVIAVVPLAALGVVAALVLRGAPNNTYTQIGVVLLVALASKNAILIVEFAADERRKGRSIADAAVNAARLRFRAILMTAFSSILGFLPLLFASGAGAASRQAVGNAVVGGMIAATFFSLLFVPTFFVVFQRLGEWRVKAEKSNPTPAVVNAPPLSEASGTGNGGAGQNEPPGRDDNDETD